MDKHYETWSKNRRIEAAIDKVINSEWTQVEAAKKYGVSRQNLNLRVKKARVALAEKVLKAREDEAKRLNRISTLSIENRRVPNNIKDFVQTYFTEWQCPDCGKHHEVPDFHMEISDAIRDPENRRVMINIPPYHSKSTVVSVWDTVLDIARNPNLRTILVSKSGPFARTFLFAIKEILTNPELYYGSARNLIDDYGPFKPEGQSIWSASEIYVAGRQSGEKDPTVLAMGAGEQIYGRRADKIKFDDIATLDNMKNPDRVMSMLEWIDKEALSRIGQAGIAIWVGTRVSAGDIYSVLGLRPGYKVIKYPALTDDATRSVLWPEHFPYEQVLIHRSEMRPADFQLVYQNVDVPGLGASFTPDMVEQSKDKSRVIGQYDTSWRLVAGLDPAGGSKGSGFTAFTLLGVDLDTGKRYVVDQVAIKSMKAPQIKDQIFDWTERYPIFEWRVESNGLQSQLVQYNAEVIQHLAKLGVRVVPHHTHTNKWDPQFGVESMATPMSADMFSIPWGNAPSAAAMQPFCEELVAFPMGMTTDRVMSTWFADLGLRDLLRRAHLPLFSSRMKVPNRIKRRRSIIDFNSQTGRRVSMMDQRPGHLTVGGFGYRRSTVGRPMEHNQVEEYDSEEEELPFNVDPNVWRPARPARG